MTLTPLGAPISATRARGALNDSAIVGLANLSRRRLALFSL
jgi:hypothetical protein